MLPAGRLVWKQHGAGIKDHGATLPRNARGDPVRAAKWLRRNRFMTNASDQKSTTPPPATVTRAVPLSPAATVLTLTDFLDLQTICEIQESFAAVTRLETTIRDAKGQPLTPPEEARRHDEHRQFMHALITDEDLIGAGTLAAPIIIENQHLGTIEINRVQTQVAAPMDEQQFLALAARLGVAADAARSLFEAARDAFATDQSAAVELLYLMANHITRLCYQEYHLRHRVDELSAMYQLARLLSGKREVQEVLDAAAESASQVMQVKAASIRLLNSDGSELLLKSVCNLSQHYLSKGPVLVAQAELYKQALAGEVVYVEDLATDPRVLYPEFARSEGIASVISTGMLYQGRAIGVIRLYTEQRRRFSQAQVNLLRAIAQLLAVEIENAQLDEQQREGQRVQRQLAIAADVQRRMLPAQMPNVPGLDIAARYVPSLELSGDFYDFIEMEGRLGVCVGDVVGKGVAASLLMASVRASLRAYAQDMYDLDEIMSRVNIAMTRDTLDKEFATLFYGVYDPGTRRLAYANAGHEPPLLARDGQIIPLDVGGMIVGVDPTQKYKKALVTLSVGDMLVIYTDGLMDALNFDQKRFGRQRVYEALQQAVSMPAQNAVHHLLWEMRRFVGLNRASDDTTIVVMKIV